jgi:hypothetical protein
LLLALLCVNSEQLSLAPQRKDKDQKSAQDEHFRRSGSYQSLGGGYAKDSWTVFYRGQETKDY